MTPKNDPKTYREMAVPFADGETANAALSAFYEGVTELRKKHRIKNAIVLCEVGYIVDGQEVDGSSKLLLGSSEEHLLMLAYAYGEARQRHEDLIALAVASGKKSK